VQAGTPVVLFALQVDVPYALVLEGLAVDAQVGEQAKAAAGELGRGAVQGGAAFGGRDGEGWGRDAVEPGAALDLEGQPVVWVMAEAGRRPKVVPAG
jgi:hypothetical protein